MILSARRAPRIHRASRSQQPGIVLGLRYERRFIAELKKAAGGVGSSRAFSVEHNPWFFYQDSSGKSGACSPDVLLWDNDLGLVHVIEVKYTWVPDALPKLLSLYCPVVSKALGVETVPLVVAKRLTPDSPVPRLDFFDVSSTVFQWLEEMRLRL